MDLAHLPEVLIFGSFRAPVYRDYEQPWNQNYFNYGKSSSSCERQENAAKSQLSKHNCHLCKESKRRKLGAYIRGKPRLNSCSEISEEEENESIEKKTSKVETEKANSSSEACKAKK